MVERIKPIKAIRSRRKKQRHAVIVDTRDRKTRVTPIRGRRRFAAEFAPDDPLETRAAAVEGSILERVVYAELVRQLNGPQGFIYKKGELGGRLFRGGIEIDFLITARHPNIAIEVLGAQWHGPRQQFQDAARAITVRGLTGEDGLKMRYAEIAEHEIRLGADFLQQKISSILGEAIDLGVPFLG